MITEVQFLSQYGARQFLTRVQCYIDAARHDTTFGHVLTLRVVRCRLVKLAITVSHGIFGAVAATSTREHAMSDVLHVHPHCKHQKMLTQDVQRECAE